MQTEVFMIYFTYDVKFLALILLFVWGISRIFRSIKYGKPDFWRETLVWLLFLFTAYLLYHTFEPFTFLLERQGTKANLVPLQGILKMIENASIFDDAVTQRIVFINLAGNILIFCPFGFLIPLLEEKLKNGWLVLLLGLTISLLIEFTQTLLVGRVFDVDDLTLNTFGTLLGFLVYAILNMIRGPKKFFERIRASARPKALGYAFGYLVFALAVTIGLYFYDYNLYKQIPQ